MTERWLDQFLNEPMGEADRGAVLDTLRDHVLGTVVIEEEKEDGSTARRVDGALVEANRDPETWEDAQLFSVVTNEAALAWHNSGKEWTEFAKTPEGAHLRPYLELAKEPPLYTFGVPESGITEYIGADAGSSGYRWPLHAGRTLAVVIWHDALHVTETGDVAPGMAGFTVTETDER